MTIKSAKCPECGAIVDIKDGLSTFYCMHCGCQLTVDGQSDTLIKAKVRVKEIEHQTERLKMQIDEEKDKRQFEFKNAKFGIKVSCAIFVALFLFINLMQCSSGSAHNKNVKKNEKLVIEIQQDIENGNFDEAEVKIQSIRDDNYSWEDNKRWKETRKTLEKQLKEAKKDAKDD